MPAMPGQLRASAVHIPGLPVLPQRRSPEARPVRQANQEKAAKNASSGSAALASALASEVVVVTASNVDLAEVAALALVDSTAVRGICS